MRPDASLKERGGNVRAHLLISLVLMGAILYVDAATPYATIHWILYLIPLLLAYRTRKPGVIMLVLAGTIVCGIAGAFLTRGRPPPLDLGALDWINRAEGFLVFVGFTFIIVALSRAQGLAFHLRDAARASEEKLRRVLECSPDAIVVIDTAGKILDCNQATLRLHGYANRDEILGLKAIRLIAVQDRARAVANAAKTLALGTVRDVEYAMLRKDGSTFPSELSTSRLDDAQGHPVGIVAVTQDVSERKQTQEALQQSNERFARIVQTSPDAIIISRVSDGVFLETSPSFADLTGYSPVEVLGRSSLPGGVGIWASAEDRQRMVAELEAHGQITGLEAPLRIKSGEVRVGLISARIIRMGGEPCILSIVRDITGRKRLENALAEREQQYRMVSELATDYAYRLGVAPDGQVSIQFVSDNFYTLTGRRREDVPTFESWSSLAHADDQGKLLSLLRELVVKPQTAEIECRSVSHGQAPRWLQVLARSEWDEREGRVTSIVGAVKDITQRKLAEDAISAEKERLAVTLGSIADAVVATDALGVVTLMNKVAEQLTGWPLAEALGRPLTKVFNCVNELTREPFENPADRVLRSGETVDLANHACLVRRDGTERVIADSAAPIRDRDGGIIGVVLVFRDMTEERRITEAIQRTARLESLGLLAGGIAHDFNNLLTGIYGYIDLARSSTRDAEITEYLTVTLSTLNRARALTMQLLTFAKGGSPVQKVVPLTPFLQDAVRFVLSGSNVAYRLSLADGLWPCNIDRNQIGQVVDNIVINAQQAMPNGGVLEIAASNVTVEENQLASLAPGNYVKLSFTDSGIGMPKDVLPRIFDPFYTTKTQGHGLGLATCYSIIIRHGGYIEAESELGKGSVFHVYLPAVTEPALLEEPSPLQYRGQGVMVVMDDEEIVRVGVRKMLERIGYEVTCTSDGREAVDFVIAEGKAGRRLAGMICDLTIRGGMGGKETIGEVRKVNREIPVFVMSGYTDDDVMKDPGAFGFAGSIAKPFTIHDLAQMLGGAEKPKPAQP